MDENNLSDIDCNEVDLTELFINADSIEYRTINQPPVSKENIKDCKNAYYKNVKFKF